MRTLEVKLYLNKDQRKQIDLAIEVCRRVWNKGLGMLREFEDFTAWNKQDKDYAPCCPLPWTLTWRPKEPEGDFSDYPLFSDKGYFPVTYCEISSKSAKGLFCPIPRYYTEPLLDRDTEYSLTPHFAHAKYEEEVDYCSVPYKLKQGTIKALATAWKEGKKPGKGKPRFKSKRDFNTVSDTQSGTAKVIDLQTLRLPKLGLVKVRGLKRWPLQTIVKSYRITRRPSGYYLLLVGELENRPVKDSDKAVGIDPGLVNVVTTSRGNRFKPAKPMEKASKKLVRLQRKAARQKLAGSGKPTSNNLKKTYQKISKLHEKISRARKAFNHKLSTGIVRQYGAIAWEDTKLTNLNRRPEPKPREDGKGYAPNRAKAKAGLNRGLTDVSIGQLRSLVEQKAKEHNREFIKVPAKNTSITCSLCGVVDKASRTTQADFSCTSCGYKENADINAAKNILQAGKDSFVRIYRD